MHLGMRCDSLLGRRPHPERGQQGIIIGRGVDGYLCEAVDDVEHFCTLADEIHGWLSLPGVNREALLPSIHASIITLYYSSIRSTESSTVGFPSISTKSQGPNFCVATPGFIIFQAEAGLIV
jgi:hypothetical protein